MKESTKRIIDRLVLPVLSLPAAAFWFYYINNTHPSKIWIVLLMFDVPFAAAALIWLCWCLFSFILREERRKRIVDWFTLIPFGFFGSVSGVFSRPPGLRSAILDELNNEVKSAGRFG